MAYFILVGDVDVNSLSYRGVQFGIPAAILFIAFLSLDSVLLKIDTSKYIILKTLSNLGDCSYTLYLCHLFCIVGINVLAKKFIALEALNVWFYFSFVILLTCTISYLLYFLIEKKIFSTLNVKKSANKYLDN
jgi:peptidoglycan/LPS O-acetylase OafA/YrhL